MNRRRRSRPDRTTRLAGRAPAGRPDGRPDHRQARQQRRRQAAAEQAERRMLRQRYRRLGGPRGQRRRFAGRILYEHRPEPFEVSTAALEAIYPFQTTPSTVAGQDAGLVVGSSVTGGTYRWDPWRLYQAGRLTNPNVLILGDVGSGKSSLAKTLVWRGLAHGRGAHIIDPKGEYAALASAAGCDPLCLRPGGGTTLNPLDPGVAGNRLSPSDLFHRNVATVQALLEATLGRPCRQLELVLVTATLARVCGIEVTGSTVTDHGHTATLTMLADALVHPDPEVARRVNMDPRQVVAESRELSLALARLVDDTGDLAGMFAGHTTIDTDRLDDLTVVDIAEIYRTHRAALPLVMICTAAWLQLAVATNPRGRFQVNDEAWALLSDQACARWMQTNQKLARQLSLSVVNVMHRLSDTAAAGDAGTATRSLAEGVIADSGTCVIYRQKAGEKPLLKDILQCNDLQARLATQLPRGRGLWIVGGETREVALVDHVLSDAERDIVDTDQQLRAAVDPSEPSS